MDKVKIYLIARISQDAHEWSNYISDALDSDAFEVFKPHEHNPWNQKHESFPKEVYETDLNAIKNSHLGLCLPEFGNDCSWECGWYSNSKKPLIAFVGNQTKWLKDWMIKGGINYVVTNRPETFEIIKNDPILSNKTIILINNMNELSSVLKNIYKKQYSNKLFGHLLNLRPYSWIDMLLVGFLAKFFVTKELSFNFQDIYFSIGILSMWLFFNSILEIKHNYNYRQKESVVMPLTYILFAIITGAFINPISNIFILFSVAFVLLYLQKNRNKISFRQNHVIKFLKRIVYTLVNSCHEKVFF